MNLRFLLIKAAKIYGQCNRITIREVLVSEGVERKRASDRIYAAIRGGYLIEHADKSISYKGDDLKPNRAPVKVEIPEGLVTDAEEIILHLNAATGSKFETRGSNKEMVIARLKSHPKSKIIEVIDFKAREWMGTTMEKYLRPATLFNKTKFEQYVGQVGMRIISNKEDEILSYDFLED